MAAAEELPDLDAARQTALEYAELAANEQGLILREEEVVSGRWDEGTGTFYPGATPYNALGLTMRRAEQNDNPVETVFARVLGFDSVNVGATAIAARGVIEADVVILQDVTVSFLEEMDEAKAADRALVNTFAGSHPENVRMGVISFARHTIVDHELAFLSSHARPIKRSIRRMDVCTSSGGPHGPC